MISFCEHIGFKPGSRVALGMSGGVDSSVAARLLMDAGFDVLGVTCMFTDDAHTRQAIADARDVADRLGIPHVVKDCTQRFACSVVDAFVGEYAAGRTPSPCVVCNRACKIPSLIEAADEAGCAFVATGHYARVVRRGGRFAVACAAHLQKDQSYMLSLLSQDQLARLLLPLGSIAEGKPRVRELAAAWGMPVASKSDSQDICFIHGSHLDFLAERGLASKPGDIVNLEGRVVGRHSGLHRYTIGQRKGLDIGGAPEPYYVVAKRPERNELVVAFARDALIGGVLVRDMVWQAASPEALDAIWRIGGIVPALAKVRYRQTAAACCVLPCCDADFASGEGVGQGTSPQPGEVPDSVLLSFDAPQATTAPGQYAVLYDGDTVLGAGVIESIMRLGSAGQ